MSELVRYMDLPKGSRFRYPGYKDTWVLLEHHGRGLVAGWDGNTSNRITQSLCSAVENYDQLADLMVELPDDPVEALTKQNEKMKGLLLLALYHHQGGSSVIGQSIRRFLGIGMYDPLTDEQIEQGKAAGATDEGHLLDVYGKPCSEWPGCGCPRYCRIPF